MGDVRHAVHLVEPVHLGVPQRALFQDGEEHGGDGHDFRSDAESRESHAGAMLAAVALRMDLGEFCGVKEFFETVSELRLEGGKFQRPLAAGTQDRNQTLVDQAVEYVVFIEILKGDAHLAQTGDDAESAGSVEGGPDAMTCKGGFNGGGSQLDVADFADHDHVRIGAHEPRIGVHHLHFSGVFHIRVGDDVALLCPSDHVFRRIF